MIVYTKNGKEILVDDDFVKPDGACLTVTSHGYATLVTATGEKTENGWYKYNRTYLHRYITGAPDGVQVDHINGDKLDNRSDNLRLCTNAQNSMNKGLSLSNKSGYKGVHRVANGKWCAQITVDYKCKTIGYYDNPHDAAIAYNKVALEQHGIFAYQNKIYGVVPYTGLEQWYDRAPRNKAS